MPALAEFQEKFKSDTNVLFLNIAFEDHDFDKWKRYIATLKLRSVQLYAEGRFESDAAKAYALEFCPIFMIINRDGTIYSTREQPPEPGTRTEANLRKALAGH